MAESRISPYSLNDLKNTTDDALGNYLRGLSFKQDNSKLDVRLAVGYTAVIIAAVIFVADYKLGWEATKNWTAVAVVAYAALNGFFTYWMYLVEKGLVFEGVRDGKKVCFALQLVGGWQDGADMFGVGRYHWHQRRRSTIPHTISPSQRPRALDRSNVPSPHGSQQMATLWRNLSSSG
jgi:hypothetical protein